MTNAKSGPNIMQKNHKSYAFSSQLLGIKYVEFINAVERRRQKLQISVVELEGLV